MLKNLVYFFQSPIISLQSPIERGNIASPFPYRKGEINLLERVSTFVQASTWPTAHSRLGGCCLRETKGSGSPLVAGHVGWLPSPPARPLLLGSASPLLNLKARAQIAAADADAAFAAVFRRTPGKLPSAIFPSAAHDRAPRRLGSEPFASCPCCSWVASAV